MAREVKKINLRESEAMDKIENIRAKTDLATVGIFYAFNGYGER